MVYMVIYGINIWYKYMVYIIYGMYIVVTVGSGTGMWWDLR